DASEEDVLGEQHQISTRFGDCSELIVEVRERNLEHDRFEVKVERGAVEPFDHELVVAIPGGDDHRDGPSVTSPQHGLGSDDRQCGETSARTARKARL